MSRTLKQPSISVRTPKNRFQNNKEAESNKIGQRVTMPTLDNITGILRYVGEVGSKPGIWAGIELDKKGQGKNDGSVQGKRYFSCAPNSGIFIAVSKIIIHPPSLPSTSSTTHSTPMRRSNLPMNRNTVAKLNASTSTSTSKRSHSLRNSAIPSTGKSRSSTPQQAPACTSPSSSSSSLPNKKSIPTPPPLTNKKFTPTTPTPTPPPIVKKATSTPTPPTPTPPPPSISQQQQQETTNQLYDMLEKTQRERDSLLLQMKNKETAWERLVSSKESLSLRVEEGESQCQRLSRQLEEAQLEMERLQHGLAERDASIAKNQRDEEKQSQDQRRIERLETLVRELQNQLQTTKDEQTLLNREHAGQVEQVRKEVTSSEAITASLEKECEELRRAGLEAIHAYEASVIQLNQKHELALQERDQLIQQLQYTVADLKHKQSTLFDDDEQDIETRLDEMKRVSNMHHSVNSDEVDQRHRLEEQLELAMTELENERLAIQTMAHEMDQLKLELNQARQQTLSIEQKFESLQVDFEKELNDKKRLIEEADNAFEAQAKAEDEHYQMKLSKMALEKEFGDLSESNKQLEQDFNNLMDEMLVLEKQDLNKGDGRVTTVSKGQDSAVLKEKIQQLENENEKHRQSLSAEKNQVSQLSKDLAELESLVESRVFGEADLEEQLDSERKKIISLEREVTALKSRACSQMKGFVISPTATDITAASSPTPSASHKEQYAEANDDPSQYCELCDGYGHDVLQCRSELSLTNNAKLFCDNCDDFGDHSTNDCPDQDETF